jgi:hypothetical protein
MRKGEERKNKLEDSIHRYTLLREAHELESWINDKVCKDNTKQTQTFVQIKSDFIKCFKLLEKRFQKMVIP